MITRFIAAVRNQTRNTSEVRLCAVDRPQRHGSQFWEVREGFTDEVTTELRLGGSVGVHQASTVEQGPIRGTNLPKRLEREVACCQEVTHCSV